MADQKKYVTLRNGQQVELSLDNPLFSDFERIPATFEEFITNPYYLGGSWKDPWEFWKEQGQKMFPLPLRSPYSSLILLGATGIGKCLPNDTNVVTSVGYTPIADLLPGQLVASNDGQFYPVIGVFSMGTKKVYDIELTNGLSCQASDDHIWTVSRDSGRTYHNETTQEILDNGCSVLLPKIKPLTGRKKKFTTSPYLLGTFLGDAPIYSYIDTSYFSASISQRKELLRGIINTKGSVLSDGTVRIALKSSRLAADVECLLNSLAYYTKVDIIEGFYVVFAYRQKQLQIKSISYLADKPCTCISIDAPKHLYMIEGGIPTHNTSFAVNMVMAYYLHVVLCLKNPQQYFALEEQKTIVFAVLNIVTKTIAYKNAWGMLHKALLKSPFFMEYGVATEGRRPEWVCTRKPIELLYGRNADDIIGLDILCCLTGDTEIKTSEGIEKLENLVNKLIQVETFNPVTKQVELSQECKVVQTKFATELIEIELENGSKIRCTPEHKLLLKSGVYKRADELTENDELQEGNNVI